MKNKDRPLNFEEEFLAITKETPAFEEYTKWLELKDRVLVLNTEIDDFLVEEIVMPILKWNKQDDESSDPYRKPITIYLNSPGGNVLIGLVIAEVIKKSRTPVHIIALSLAASMGSVILASGHKRYAYEFTNVLIHDGDLGVKGTTNKVRDSMKFFEDKHKQIKDFLINNSKITAEKYEEMADREWWMTASTALELGLIDEIIGDTKNLPWGEGE